MRKKPRPSDILAVAVFTTMLSVTFLNVISRYFFHFAISFSEELVTRLAVLLACLGAAQAIREESHYDIPLLENFIPKKVTYAFNLISAVLMMCFCGYLAFAGVQMVSQQYALQHLSSSMRIYEWVYGSAIPIGCGFMAYYASIALVRTIKRRGAAFAAPAGEKKGKGALSE